MCPEMVSDVFPYFSILIVTAVRDGVLRYLLQRISALMHKHRRGIRVINPIKMD